MGIVRVELNPLLATNYFFVLKLKAHNGSLLLFVRPVPQRNRLVLVGSQGHDVLAVVGQVHLGDTAGMGVQEGPDGRSGQGVPDHQHRVVSFVGRYDPAFIGGARRRGDPVTVALEEFLGAAHVVVDDTSVGSGVKQFLDNKLAVERSLTVLLMLFFWSYPVKKCTPWSRSLLKPLTHSKF